MVQVLVKIGFVGQPARHFDPEATPVLDKKSNHSFGHAAALPAPAPLDAEETAHLAGILSEVIKEKRSGSRLSRSERILEAPPTEGVGTLKIGASPIIASSSVRGERFEGQRMSVMDDSASDVDDDEDDGYSTASGYESYSDTAGQTPGETSSDVDDTDNDYFGGHRVTSSPHESDNEVLDVPLPVLEPPSAGPSPLQTMDTVKPMPTPLRASETVTLASLQQSSSNASGSSATSGDAGKTVRPEAHRSQSRKVLSLPNFMKRSGSSKSVATANSSNGLTVPSDLESGQATPGSIAPSTSSSSGRTRFGRKKTDSANSFTDNENDEAAAGGPPRRRRIRRRKTKDTTTSRTSRRDRKAAATAYSLGGLDDILGICFLEVKSAKDLPKWKNATRLTVRAQSAPYSSTDLYCSTIWIHLS